MANNPFEGKGYSGSGSISSISRDDDTQIQKDSLDEILDYEKENERKLHDYKVQLSKQGIVLEEKERQRLLKGLNALSEKEEREQARKIEKERSKLRREGLKAELKDAFKDFKVTNLKDFGKSLKEVVKNSFDTENIWGQTKQSIRQLGDLIAGSISKALEGVKDIFSSDNVKAMMDTYGKYQESINARIQGTGQTFQKLQSGLLSTIGINPYVKTQTMLDNLQSLVQQGIAFNLEQRAFLASISDKIATTFDVANSALLRIVKLQQQDSTASRLGMEAYMTRFLNNMFQNTEYLTNEFDNVTAALVEATSQMTTQAGVEFEYIVQKWLGSLSSVGLSSNTVTSLAQAIGYLASGDWTSLESSGMSQLLALASSKAGLDFGSIVGNISLNQTNQLLKSVVTTLSEIGSNTNKVVKNQYAQTFGVTVSDLTAAKNIGESIGTIYDNVLSYVGSIQELQYQAGQITERVSVSSMISNLSENIKYSLLSTIAASPIMSAVWRLADFSESITGGIKIPFAGTTVEGLAKAVLGGTSIIGAVGDVISGLGSTFNFASALSRLGVSSNLTSTTRGTGIGTRESGFGSSQSSYLGQSSSDFYLSEGQQTVEQYGQKYSDEKTSTDIYNLLTDSNATTIAKVQLVEGDYSKNELSILSSIDSNVSSILSKLEDGIVRVVVENSTGYLLGA